MSAVTLIEPTLRGKYGAAWLLDHEAIKRHKGVSDDDPRASVTLPSWVVHAAYAHPIWSYYVVFCVALRDTPGVPKSKILLEGATHEVIVFALHPDETPAVDAMPQLLYPANFVGQFIEPDDAAAATRIKQTVQDVTDGILNPDTDFLSQWVERFGDSNLKANALTPDAVVTTADGVIVVGTGASAVKKLQQAVEISEMLRADETKPQ